MNEAILSTIDDSTEVTLSISTTLNSTASLPTTSTSPSRQTVSAQTVAAVGLLICSIGACGNSIVLTVLVRARRHAHSSVHTLIANQSAMDLFACVFGMVTLVIAITRGFKYNGNRIVDGAICMLFEDETSTTVQKTLVKYSTRKHHYNYNVGRV